MNFQGRDFVDIVDFTRSEVERVFKTADRMERLLHRPSQSLQGKIMATLFFEPSTRTRLSFEAAMKRLGGDVIGFAESTSSSVTKGETLVDTVRVVENYADIIVLRHPLEGSAKIAAANSRVPVINAGSGALSHPTQALLDLYTIRRERGRIDGLRIALVGDLKYGRTVHSLAYGLGMYRVKLCFVSPKVLRMREEVLDDMAGRGVRVEEYENVESIISSVDVIYATRIQKERFPDPLEYEKVRGSYTITPQLLKQAKDNMILLHPLPRTDELAAEVDATPYAKYFAQARYGLLTRMALLWLILGSDKQAG